MSNPIRNSELKQIAFAILSDVASFCDRRHIQYYLVCGTALGAVRHGGFIPWDDDVDIGMPRPDYERFLAEYPSERYRLAHAGVDPDYPYAFAKVCDPETILIENIAHPCKLGVYIDIFPIDGLPDTETEQKKHLKRIDWDLRILAWKRISRSKKVGFLHKLVQIAAKALLSFVPVSVLVARVDRDVRRYPYESCKNVGHLTTCAIWGSDVKPRRVFEPPVKHRFESGEFWLPGNYDEYLRLEYGDYMKLPPEEKRVAKHDFAAYWKSGCGRTDS